MLKISKAYFPVHLVVNVVAIGGPLSLLAIGGLAISGSPVAQLLGVEVPYPTEFSGKNGDFAGKIWSFSWNLTCWDSTFETRDFAMKHGEDLRICPGMEHNWVFKLMAFNHSSFGHFQGKLTTSQCHYVCRFPALILAALTTHQYMC